MNERFKSMVAAYGDSDLQWNDTEVEKFAESIYKDIITVVAAQALLNESALDVFKNLKRIYEGEEQ